MLVEANSFSGTNFVPARLKLAPAVPILTKPSVKLAITDNIPPSLTFLVRLRSGESLSLVAILLGIHSKNFGKEFLSTPERLSSRSFCLATTSTTAPVPRSIPASANHLKNLSLPSF